MDDADAGVEAGECQKNKSSWTSKLVKRMASVLASPTHYILLAAIGALALYTLISKCSARRLLYMSAPEDDADEQGMRDAAFIRRLLSDSLLTSASTVKLSDIVGQTEAKEALLRSVVWPFVNPRLFRGLRSPPPALLLYGPPGCGKTMLVKAIYGLLPSAHQIAFFNVSASTFSAKYHGDAERLVRCLFKAARESANGAIIFVDEVDAIVGARGSQSEDDVMRRLKTELLVNLDGLLNGLDGRRQDACKVILIAATNLPHHLDAAFLRRCGRRVHVGLPSPSARHQQLRLLLQSEPLRIREDALRTFAENDLKGYTGSDVKNVAREAALAALDEVLERHDSISRITVHDIPPITMQHLLRGTQSVRPSLTASYSKDIEAWENCLQ